MALFVGARWVREDRIFPGRFLTGTEADRSCEKRSRLVGINIRVVLKESLLHPRHERVRSEQAEEHAARDGDRRGCRRERRSVERGLRAAAPVCGTTAWE